MTEEGLFAGLNPAQKEAIEHVEGPLLILAGPGSGKTRVITQRIAYLVKTVGVSPHHIMAVTFTNKAAREMRDRVARLARSAVDRLTLGTFHAISARILRVDGGVLGIDPHFVIYDSDDQISLVKRSLEQLNLDPKQYTPRALVAAISSAKSALITPEIYVNRAGSYFEEIAGRVYTQYDLLLKSAGALDFDDLLMKVTQLFEQHPAVLEKYQQRYVHVMVDEFQDTNPAQYQIVKGIGAGYRNICVVGDPDQSIYSWRAADMRNILNFEKDYPDAKVVLLEQNYRSTQLILDAASCVIQANPKICERKLWTENEGGTPINVVETYTEQEEAQFVVSEVERLVSHQDFSLKDFAVMYRTNAQSRTLEEAFIRYGTTYKLVAGTRFYERREVKDIIAYLRVILNQGDSVSLMRIINVPGRGIGQRSVASLQGWAQEQGITEYQALLEIAGGVVADRRFTPQLRRALTAFTDLLQGLIEASRDSDLTAIFDLVLERAGYREHLFSDIDGEERWENVMELRTVTQDYREFAPREGLSAFLEGVALVSDVDGLNTEVDAVTLITLHQAKGMEYPVVFIVGMEEGILPHIRSFDDPAQMEEERRLCYVGITRAGKQLYMVRAFRRNLAGQSGIGKPSRFLDDIPARLTQSGGSGLEEESSIRRALHQWHRQPQPAEKRSVLPASGYRDGDHVHHAQFGEGVVVSSRTVGDDYEVVVAFNGGVKKLLASFAKLEKPEKPEDAASPEDPESPE